MMIKADKPGEDSGEFGRRGMKAAFAWGKLLVGVLSGICAVCITAGGFIGGVYVAGQKAATKDMELRSEIAAIRWDVNDLRNGRGENRDLIDKLTAKVEAIANENGKAHGEIQKALGRIEGKVGISIADIEDARDQQQ
jgi:hypothetical protein